MSLVIPPDLKQNLEAQLRHVPPAFIKLLEHERERTLDTLADATAETLMRQQQGRARCLKDLLELIDSFQR